MSAQRDALKLFFQTGDVPTQSQFYQWLDDTIFADEFSDLWFSNLDSVLLTGLNVAGSANTIPTTTDTVFTAIEKMAKLLTDISSPLDSSSDIKFDLARVYGRFNSPITASSLTLDLTGAKVGQVALVVHEAASEPSYSVTVNKTVASGLYDGAKKNYMYFTFMGGTKVSLFITQDV